jgi:tRNA-uridine 2-sulfurtransferase
MKIAVGMSGGVDSSVAACLLKSQGHDVEGIMMSVWDGAPSQTTKKHACYGPDEAEDIAEAKRICEEIGIRFHVFNCSHDYKDIIVGDFRREYLSARTPNPCVRCNQRLKFGSLLDAARSSGLTFNYFATGHYARITKDLSTGRFLLMKGIDEFKDQSYFLYRLSQQQLSCSMFPLGHLTKNEVRDIARSFGLFVSEKKESQDFYSGDYRELLNTADKPGDIIRSDGKLIGHHTGLWNFTPGQRRGLRVSDSEPLYVIKLDSEKNSVIVGKKEECLTKNFIVFDTNLISEEKLMNENKVQVRLRSGMNPVDALISETNNFEISVDLLSPHAFVSPGQSAVFYNGDTVIGGGIIKLQHDDAERRAQLTKN